MNKLEVSRQEAVDMIKRVNRLFVHTNDVQYVGAMKSGRLVGVAAFQRGKLSNAILNEDIPCKLFGSCSRAMELINFIVLENGCEPALMSAVITAARDMDADFVYTLLDDLQALSVSRSGAYFPYQGEPKISYGTNGERLMIASWKELSTRAGDYRITAGLLT
jgi:hypothetical protein